MTAPRRALVLGLLAAALASSGLTSAAAARPGGPAPGLAPGLARAAEAQDALAEVRAVLGAGGRPTRDATLALRDLARLREALPAADGDEAAGYLSRPASDEVTCGLVCVHWRTTGADAVDPTDLDLNTVPDYVDTVLATLDSVHTTYAAAGYRSPKPDGGRGGDSRTDVYLGDIGPEGLYGYCTSDQSLSAGGPHDAWAYCVLDNDYASDEFPSNTPLENLQVTAAHEYFHAVQFAYDIFEDAWFMEATATWAEDELYDDVDDNVQYLPEGPQGRPRMPLDQFVGLHQYGDWIFFRYLTERLTEAAGDLPRLVLDMWRKADAAPGGPDKYSTQAIAAVLSQQGTTLTRAFAAFAHANRRPAVSYEEGADNSYPRSGLWQRVTLSSASKASRWLSLPLDHLSSATARFTPGSGLGGGGWRLRLMVDLADKSAGSAVVATVHLVSGEVRVVAMGLDFHGDAVRSVPFSSAEVAWVEVTLVNASTRFRCWTGGEFSCEGQARDDNVTEWLRGVAFR